MSTMNPQDESNPSVRVPLVLGGHDFKAVSDLICAPIERKAPSWWMISFVGAVSLLCLFVSMISYLVWEGIGVWGLNNPVMWGYAIINFVFWVGIGHAGTLISAILFLFRQKWRTSINRFSEAMTIFAVICAGMFPVFHVGRVWAAYFLFPVPNQMGAWPNFRSPLLWDVFAVSTYFTVSLMFWFVGLVPDIATLRDRATSRTRQAVFGFFAMGDRKSVV